MKRGQVTLFVLVGVLIVAIIVLFFIFFARNDTVEVSPAKTPRLFIERCVADSVTPSIRSVLDNGGLIDVAFGVAFDNHTYNYLCYNGNYYGKCYNYYPFLHRKSEEMIRADSVGRVDECFGDLFVQYQEQGLDVENGALNYSVEIVPGSVRLRIDKDFTATKGANNELFDEFDMKIPSDLYDLIGVSRAIVNAEAEYCYFETAGFMSLYPLYNITRFDYDTSKIYEVQNRQTKEVLKFAVRSCAYAPGF